METSIIFDKTRSTLALKYLYAMMSSFFDALKPGELPLPLHQHVYSYTFIVTFVVIYYMMVVGYFDEGTKSSAKDAEQHVDDSEEAVEEDIYLSDLVHMYSTYNPPDGIIDRNHRIDHLNTLRYLQDRFGVVKKPEIKAMIAERRRQNKQRDKDRNIDKTDDDDHEWSEREGDSEGTKLMLRRRRMLRKMRKIRAAKRKSPDPSHAIPTEIDWIIRDKNNLQHTIARSIQQLMEIADKSEENKIATLERQSSNMSQKSVVNKRAKTRSPHKVEESQRSPRSIKPLPMPKTTYSPFYPIIPGSPRKLRMRIPRPPTPPRPSQKSARSRAPFQSSNCPESADSKIIAKSGASPHRRPPPLPDRHLPSRPRNSRSRRSPSLSTITEESSIEKKDSKAGQEINNTNGDDNLTQHKSCKERSQTPRHTRNRRARHHHQHNRHGDDLVETHKDYKKLHLSSSQHGSRGRFSTFEEPVKEYKSCKDRQKTPRYPMLGVSKSSSRLDKVDDKEVDMTARYPSLPAMKLEQPWNIAPNPNYLKVVEREEKSDTLPISMGEGSNGNRFTKRAEIFKLPSKWYSSSQRHGDIIVEARKDDMRLRPSGPQYESRERFATSEEPAKEYKSCKDRKGTPRYPMLGVSQSLSKLNKSEDKEVQNAMVYKNCKTPRFPRLPDMKQQQESMVAPELKLLKDIERNENAHPDSMGDGSSGCRSTRSIENLEQPLNWYTSQQSSMCSCIHLCLDDDDDIVDECEDDAKLRSSSPQYESKERLSTSEEPVKEYKSCKDRLKTPRFPTLGVSKSSNRLDKANDKEDDMTAYHSQIPRYSRQSAMKPERQLKITPDPKHVKGVEREKPDMQARQISGSLLAPPHPDSMGDGSNGAHSTQKEENPKNPNHGISSLFRHQSCFLAATTRSSESVRNGTKPLVEERLARINARNQEANKLHLGLQRSTVQTKEARWRY